MTLASIKAAIDNLLNFKAGLTNWGGTFDACMNAIKSGIESLWNEKAPTIHIHDGAGGSPLVSQGGDGGRIGSGDTLHIHTGGRLERVHDGQVAGILKGNLSIAGWSNDPDNGAAGQKEPGGEPLFGTDSAQYIYGHHTFDAGEISTNWKFFGYPEANNAGGQTVGLTLWESADKGSTWATVGSSIAMIPATAGLAFEVDIPGSTSSSTGLVGRKFKLGVACGTSVYLDGNLAELGVG